MCSPKKLLIFHLTTFNKKALHSFCVSVVYVMYILNRDAASTPTPLHSQLKIFQKCHVKIITFANEISSGEWKSETEILDELLAKFRTNRIVVVHTLERSIILRNGEDGDAIYFEETESMRYHQNLKLNHCFVHLYVPLKNTYEYLKSVTDEMRAERQEWPHHVVFVDTDDLTKNDRLLFYKRVLPISAFRGLILSIDLRTEDIYTICVPCAWMSLPAKIIFRKTDLSEFNSLDDAHIRLSLPLHSNLHLSYVKNGVPIGNLPDYCDFMSRARPVNMPTFTTSGHCIHLPLSLKFNYTFNRALRSHYIFFMSKSVDIIEFNVQAPTFKNRMMEWIPFGVELENQEFVAIQRPPSHFSGDALIKPYDWRGWSLCLVTALSLFLVTAFVAYNENLLTASQLASIVQSVLSSILGQPITAGCEIAGKIKIFGSQILGLLWLIWVVMLVVLVNGYTGFVFSYLAARSDPKWPGSIKELTNDDQYCVVSMEIHGYKDDKRTYISSFVRDIFLKPIMIGEPGVAYPIEYFKLNNTLIFHENVDTMGELLAENLKLPGTIDDPFGINGNKCLKFALLQASARRDSISILYILKNVVVSEPIVLPQFATLNAPYVTRNFFTTPFQKALAVMDSMGFFFALKNHFNRWLTCYEMEMTQRFLKQGIPHSSNTFMFRCLTQISGSIINPNKLMEAPYPEKISLPQISAILKIGCIGLLISLVVILTEHVMQVVSPLNIFPKVCKLGVIECLSNIQGQLYLQWISQKDCSCNL